MAHRPNLYAAVLLAFAQLLMFNKAASEVIDNFSRPRYNNMGGLRCGLGINVNLLYPIQGITIATSWEYLIEPVALQGRWKDLSGKSLKIEYTASNAGNRTIKFLQSHPFRDTIDGTSFHTTASFLQGRNHLILPLSQFGGVELTLSHGFGIGGPLVVHCLELVEASPESANLVLQSSAADVDHAEIHDELLSQIESPSLQLHQHPEFNSIKMKRGGRGVTQIHGGIRISGGGYLGEEILDGTEPIDRSAKRIRITYTSAQSSLLHLQIRHQEHYGRAYRIGKLKQFHIFKGCKNTIDITISSLPGFEPRKLTTIYVLGPATLHRIDFVDHPSGSSHSVSNPGDEIIQLVDDLSSWTSAIPCSTATDINLTMSPFHIPCSNHLANAILPSFSSVDGIAPLNANSLNFDPISDEHESGLNNFNLPCGGIGALVGPHGIKLSNHGMIYEQLVPKVRNLPDLSYSVVEIHYSAMSTVTRQIVIHTFVTDEDVDGHEYQSEQIDTIFKKEMNGRVHVDAMGTGRTLSFRICGQGELIIHRIQLLICRDLSINKLVLDDFTNWLPPGNFPKIGNKPFAAADSIISSQVDKTLHDNYDIMVNPDSTFFDYRYPPLHVESEYYDAAILVKQGVKIMEHRFWFQPLPRSVGMTIKITYSADFARTRKIVLITCSGDGGSQENTSAEHTIYIMINGGVNQEVNIPLPKSSVVITGLRIHGPLTMHRMVLLHAPRPTNLMAGDSSIDHLLLDDFTGWRAGQFRSATQSITNIPYQQSGSISLHEHEVYRIEHIEDDPVRFNLDDMVVQITYTIEHPVECSFSLVSERRIGPTRGSNTYQLALQPVNSIAFNAGSNIQLIIPISKLVRIKSTTNPRFYSLHLHGPPGCNPLTLLRIELSCALPFSCPIVPKYYADLLSSKIGSTQLRLESFRRELNLLKMDGKLNFPVRRDHLWTDVHRIMDLAPIELQKTLNVSFIGEPGLDAGGLTSEFFTLLSDVINDTNLGLFTSSPDANYALQINAKSALHADDHLVQFRLVGRIIGMAILSQNLLIIKLVPLLYKSFINIPLREQSELPDLLETSDVDVDISDLKTIDQVLHTHLDWCLHNNITDLPEMTMTVDEVDQNGNSKTHNLVKDGHMHIVTQANKKQYVQEYANWHLFSKISDQARALCDGVWDIVPQSYLSLLTQGELETVVAGNSVLDIDDWMDHTKYEFGYTSSHPVIVHFWACLQDWNNDERSRLLQFVTGSPRVPSTGFFGLENKFTISYTPDTTRLPTASTCTNTLNLPPFTDPDMMRQKLVLLIEGDTGYFGFV